MGFLDDDLEDKLDDKIIEKIVKEFDVHKDHIKPGTDCVGNVLSPGDLVLIIAPSTKTKTRLVPAIVIKHTKVKTQVNSIYSYMRTKWVRDEHGDYVEGETKVAHSSYYPEQIIKIDIGMLSNMNYK